MMIRYRVCGTYNSKEISYLIEVPNVKIALITATVELYEIFGYDPEKHLMGWSEVPRIKVIELEES